MAIKSSLRLITRRIANAVKKVAADHGVNPGDYALVGSLDEHADRISLIFGTDQNPDEKHLYAAILDEIQRNIPEYPEITFSINLVIRRVTNLDEVYLESVSGEDELDLTELFERP